MMGQGVSYHSFFFPVDFHKVDPTQQQQLWVSPVYYDWTHDSLAMALSKLKAVDIKCLYGVYKNMLVTIQPCSF